ncbi:hypothetical protein EJ078_06315 [Mesorhizobium sp. M1A.F.Ca.IN.022.06.1.1]|nr:hypothetical protein EJ078_06315 [Mesorhizobium sp. M1A.F.Ca.IN.022.06.1.1]
MPRRETPLEMAQRHVREGAERIAHQRALIARMELRGQSIGEAEHRLREFQAAQRQHTDHLRRLRDS